MSSNPPNHDQDSEHTLKHDSKTEVYVGMEKDHSYVDMSLTLKASRKVCSFRGDPELWREFVRFAEEEYGSVCHVLEAMIKAVVSAHVEYSKKERPVFEIRELHIERVVQRSRRIYGEPEFLGEPTSWRKEGSPQKCAVPGCGMKAFARGNYGEVLMWLCKDHFLERKARLRSWHYLEASE